MLLSFGLSMLLVHTAPCVAVAIDGTGLSDAAQSKVAARIGADLRDAKIATCPAPVDVECAVDRACAAEAMRTAGARALLVVDIVRAGPLLQVEARVLDTSGRATHEGTQKVRAGDLSDVPPLVPPDLVDALAPPPPSPAPPPPAPEPPAPPPLAPAEAPPAAPPPAATSEDEAIAPLALAGIGAFATGMLVVVGAAAVTAGQLGVIRSATATGDDKEAASVIIPVAVVAGGVGAAVATAGGVLVFLGTRE